MKRSWLEVGSHEEVPCVPLGGLTATCMPSELQLACRQFGFILLLRVQLFPLPLKRCRSSTLLLYTLASYP